MSIPGRAAIGFVVAYLIAWQFLMGVEGWKLFLGSAVIAWVSTGLATGMVSLIAASSNKIVFGRHDLVALAGAQLAEAAGATAGTAAAGLATLEFLSPTGAAVGVVIASVATRALRSAAGAMAIIGALVGALIGAVAATAVWGPWGIAAALSVGPTVYGSAAGVLLVSVGIRIGATLHYLWSGLKTLPRNFRRLCLCTSPLQAPELVPGLLDGETRFTLQNFWAEFHNQNDLLGYAISSVLLFAWFVPGWVYRFVLKSTFCFWWPLAFLGGPAKDSKNPEWFHTKVLQTLRGKFTVKGSIVVMTVFALQQYLQQKHFENPFLNVFGYAFTIDWSARSWQICAALGALLSVAILFWTDWEFKKFGAADRTGDGALKVEAERHFFWIEVLQRVRALLLLVYCFLVLFHAVMYLNTFNCWFTPTSGVQARAEFLYSDYLPPTHCSH